MSVDNCQPPTTAKVKASAANLGIKLSVASLIDVAACKIPITKPTTKEIPSKGAEISTVIHKASRPISTTAAVSIVKLPNSQVTKLAANDPRIRLQPSTSTNNINLKGIEIIIGESIIMPMDIKTLATIKSMTTKGV
jgi:hypothetical protein